MALIIAAVVVTGIIGYGTINYEKTSDPNIVIRENPEIEINNTDEYLTLQEKLAIDYIQNYKGDDNQGNSIAYVIGQIVSTKYSDEIIYDSSTRLGWSAYSDPDDKDPYGVSFDFVSDTDEFSFLWYVDLKNNTVYSPGGGSAEILEIFNSNS